MTPARNRPPEAVCTSQHSHPRPGSENATQRRSRPKRRQETVDSYDVLLELPVPAIAHLHNLVKSDGTKPMTLLVPALPKAEPKPEQDDGEREED